MKLTMCESYFGLGPCFVILPEKGEKLQPNGKRIGKDFYGGELDWVFRGGNFYCPCISELDALKYVLEDCSIFFPGIDFAPDAAELTMKLL
jgi:hypothetical protein